LGLAHGRCCSWARLAGLVAEPEEKEAVGPLSEREAEMILAAINRKDHLTARPETLRWLMIYIIVVLAAT